MTQAVVFYTRKPSNDETVHSTIKRNEDGSRTIDSNIHYVEYEVSMADIRNLSKAPNLKDNGFSLCKIDVPNDIDWENEADIKKRLYPSVHKVLEEATGASRVFLFDHTLRKGKIQPTALRDGKLQGRDPNGPIQGAHCDYTKDSGIGRLHELLPDEAEALQKTPFAVIQVWRPLKGPVQASPLALADASTVDTQKDLSTHELRFPDRTGYVTTVHHNPDHRWYYAKGMNTDECYLFVCYDSRFDRARFTPHCAFTEAGTPEDAPPRESVELRAYVFWENEPPQRLERKW